MSQSLGRIFSVLCVLTVTITLAGQTRAQMSEAKEKPPMYTYLGNWAIPRAQWADMEKNIAADQKTLEKALAGGTIVAYGNDTNLVHQQEGDTHDDWWSAMSMAGLLNVLEQFYKSGSTTAPVLVNATRHSDAIYVTRHYNWHSGSWKDVYTHASSYKLKADAPENAVDTLSKNLFEPFFEKLLADGAIHEYEIDTEAIHTQAPGSFFVVYIAANAEGLDKVNAALREVMKSNPLGGPAFDSMVDFTPHRDYLARTNATFK
jgi:hypothetical protein